MSLTLNEWMEFRDMVKEVVRKELRSANLALVEILEQKLKELLDERGDA